MFSNRNLVISVLLLAFVLRLGFALYWQRCAQAENRLFRLGDSHSYWTLAEHIAQGKPYQYGSSESKIFRAPLYPLLLSPITLIDDESLAILTARLVGCFLGSIAVGLLMVVAWRFGGSFAAIACGLLAAGYPGAIGMSAIVLSESLFVPLMVANLILWHNAWIADQNKKVRQWALLAGVSAALAVLARPSWLLFLPFAGMAGVVVLRGDLWKRHCAIVLLSFVGFSITMVPWWIRNATVTGHFVPTTLQVGPSLYDGLHDGATGASDEGMLFMEELLDQQIESDRTAIEAPQSTLEYRLNQRAMTAAVDWATDHPVETVRLAAAKFARTWSVWPDGGDISSTATRLAITLSCFSVLLLAIAGSVLTIRRFRWSIAIYWLPCIYFTLLHMVFVGSVRYREPAVFVLTALAGCTVSSLLGGRNRRRDT